MSTTPVAPVATELNVAEFLNTMLATLSRRAATREERAKIQWWKARVGLLAEQEPKAQPVTGEAVNHPAAA